MSDKCVLSHKIAEINRSDDESSRIQTYAFLFNSGYTYYVDQRPHSCRQLRAWTWVCDLRPNLETIVIH